jgi:hypothetical protein
MRKTAYFKQHKIPLLLAIVSLIFYASFAYDLVRTDYIKLFSLYAGLFFLFYKLIQLLKHNVKLLTWLSFGFRTVFILAIPNLSQDFYRFIWDGQLLLLEINPYLSTPDLQMSLGVLSDFPNQNAIYEGMGSLSASHFTNYPPLNQLSFAIANLFPGTTILSSVVGIRLIVIAADFGTLYYGKKLLEHLKLPAYTIFWYLLNPFIIIELTGNLHFEGLMIFFLAWSLYLLQVGKWQRAAIALACSISVKLIPLIFLPLFYGWFKKKKTLTFTAEGNEKPQTTNHRIPTLTGMRKLIGFYAIVVFITILLFLPFYSLEFVTNYAGTVGLWFQNFEFNASLYYLFREIGYWISGYNQIAVIGKLMAISVFIIVIAMALFRKNNTTHKLILSMLLALTAYYFLSTTAHPWYVATLLFLSVFTNFKFPLVWSFMIAFSYLAYANNNNTENLWIIAFEYIVVFSVFLHDLKKVKPVDN